MYTLAVLVFTALFFFFCRFFWVISRHRRPYKFHFNAEEAASALEFTLVFPLFLMIILIIWQLLLLVNATQVVSYAAFSAARSAIVVIPMSVGGEGPNQYNDSESSKKKETITQAAAIACTPISPPIGELAKSSVGGAVGAIGSLGGLSGDVAMLALLVNNAGLNGTRAVQKALYASQFTEVTVSGPMERGAFASDAPITVKVAYKFFLNVPYAKRIFNDNFFAGFGLDSFQKTLTAQYTLPNEGAKEIL